MECQECHVMFSTRGNMKRHVKSKHGRTDPVEQIDCPHCYAVLPNALRLRTHVQTYHPLVIKTVAWVQNVWK